MRRLTVSTILPAVGVAFFLCGCASSRLAAPTAAFATCVPALQTSAQSATTRLLAADPDSEAKAIAAQSKFGNLTTPLVTPFISEGDLLIEMKALQGLTDYANALKNLANIDTSTDSSAVATSLNADMKSLGTDISALPITSKALSANAANSSGIAGCLATIGMAVVDAVKAHKRDEAVKAALIKAQPAVDTICAFFSTAMIRKNGEFWNHLDIVFDKQQEAQSDAFKQSYDKLQADKKVGKDSDTLAKDETDELSQASKFAKIVQTRQLTLGLIAAIGDAFEKLKEAHAELVRYSQSNGVNRASLQSKLDALNAQLETVSAYSTLLKGGK